MPAGGLWRISRPGHTNSPRSGAAAWFADWCASCGRPNGRADAAQGASDASEEIFDVRPLDHLNDMVEHVVNGNDALLDQDIAVIERNIDAVRKTLTGKAQAAYDGVQEGLGECDY